MTHRAYLIIACLCGIILAQWVPATPIGLPWFPAIGQSSPFGVDQFAVLIVEESKSREAMAKEQQVIILGSKSGSVRDYCERKGKFRVFDLSPDGDVSRVEPFWKVGIDAAMAKGVTPPYMVAGSKGRSYVGPLPKDTATALEILKPMGGE